jgi:hypothetical protein
METYIETFTLSIVLVLIALVLISLGWLFTGKQNIKRGMCSRDPTKVNKESCEKEQSCPMCDHGAKKEEKSE